MEHFAELLLEFLFSLHKDTPEHIPVELEYSQKFSVRYPSYGILVVLSVLMIGASVTLAFIGNGIEFALLLAIPAFACLCIYVYQITVRIDVNEVCIEERTLLLFRKRIPWESVKCIRLIENDNEKNVIIALYRHDGKHLTDYSSDMLNFWLVFKMAEHKEIEIRKEKNLSIKEIMHL